MEEFVLIQQWDLFSHEKGGNLAIYDNVDEPGGHKLIEVSQTQKDNYCVISLTGGHQNSGIHKSRE